MLGFASTTPVLLFFGCTAYLSHRVWRRSGTRPAHFYFRQSRRLSQTLIQTHADEIATLSGWDKENSTTNGKYTKPLPINEGAARSRLGQLLHHENGRLRNLITLLDDGKGQG